MILDTSLRDPVRRAFLRPFAAGAVLLLAGCGGSSPGTPPASDDPTDDTPVAVPARGTAETFDVATWNVEWFGDAGNGPSDDARQLARVRDVILGADLDLWAVQEIVDEGDFAALLAELPGYEGFLANAPTVTDGPAFYSDFSGNEQKVGLLWKSSVVSIANARIVLTGSDYEFAGRPPLEVTGTATVAGTTRAFTALVLHAKASTDEESWNRRLAASTALKGWLDSNWAEVPVWVLGDFNDDIDVSIREGSASPYENFVADAGQWRFVTDELSAAGVSSTVGYSDVIDHLLVSDEAAAGYIPGSAEAFRLDAIIDDYGDTTSDHFPVLARFQLGG